MICGVDEAGRGPVLGPLVVAAVCVRDQRWLKALGVRDSKRLSPQRREQLAVEIRRKASDEVIIIPAHVLDSLRADRSLNILEAEVFAAAIARFSPRSAYVDAADVSEENFRRAIERCLPTPCRLVSEHYADDTYPVVSAAGILAKVTRDREIRRIEADLGQRIGSGYCHDPTTLEFLRSWLRKHGQPPPHCRTSWETTRRLLSELGQETLDRF